MRSGQEPGEQRSRDGWQKPASRADHVERLCRYALRSPLAQDRIRLTADGDVLLEFRHRWSDGTTHLRFHPLELLERLASLTPRPRINLVLYYGVLGAHAAWRMRLPRPGVTVPTAAAGLAGASDGSSRPMAAAVIEGSTPAPTGSAPPTRSGSNWLWAQLMRRSFGFDVLSCPRCGRRLALVALIEQGEAVQRILRHLGLPAEVPPPRPARAPPPRRPAWNFAS